MSPVRGAKIGRDGDGLTEYVWFVGEKKTPFYRSNFASGVYTQHLDIFVLRQDDATIEPITLHLWACACGKNLDNE